jgi:hypothetical protein
VRTLISISTYFAFYSLPVDLVTLENLDSSFEAHGLHRNNNNSLIGIREMVDTLATVYEKIEVGQENISTAICIDLTLNWLLNVYDR